MRVATLAWFAPLLLGCGGVSVSGLDGGGGDDGDGTEADAGEDPDAATPPQPDATPACRWTELDPAPFASVNSADPEQSTTFDASGLVLFFTRAAAGQSSDIYDAVRDTLDLPFGGPRLIGELSLPGAGEYEVELSASGEEIFFIRDTSDEILTSARVRGAGFGEVRFTGLKGTSPALSLDGLALYFIDDLGADRIMRVARSAVGQDWGTPEEVGSPRGYPWIDVSADELSLLLSGGAGTADQPAIAIATRASVDVPFGEPVSAGAELNGTDPPSPGEASWDASGRRVAVSIGLDRDNPDLFQSTCE
jgi:hypothetical protein